MKDLCSSPLNQWNLQHKGSQQEEEHSDLFLFCGLFTRLPAWTGTFFAFLPEACAWAVWQSEVQLSILSLLSLLNTEIILMMLLLMFVYLFAYSVFLFVCWFYPVAALQAGFRMTEQIKQVATMSTLQKITLSFKKSPWLLMLVDFPHLLLYHYSLCASSCTILSSASESRNHIITMQPAAYPLCIFIVTLGTLFPSRSLLASAVQQLSTSKCGKFSTT